jgi:hypothetical protein
MRTVEAVVTPVVETALSAAELLALRDIVGTMIPENAERRMPGADDPAILADIGRTLGRDTASVRKAIEEIGAKAGGAFAALDRDRREVVINDCHASQSPSMMTLGRVVLGAYYRDDRVLLRLGMEPGAPFPKGYIVEQGDWSLLDAVRGRPQLWRDDRPGANRGR